MTRINKIEKLSHPSGERASEVKDIVIENQVVIET